MQVTPQSPIFGMLLILYLMTPSLPHVHSFDANFDILPIPCSYCTSVFPSRVTTVNLPRNVAVCKAFFHTLYLIFNDKFSFFIIYCDLPPIVDNTISYRESLCRLAFPVNSNSRFNIHAFLIGVFSSLVFSPTLSHLIFLTW